MQSFYATGWLVRTRSRHTVTVKRLHNKQGFLIRKFMSAGASLNDCSSVEKQMVFLRVSAWTWVIITFPSSIRTNLSTISLPHPTIHHTRPQTRAPWNSCFLWDWNLTTAHSWADIVSANAPYRKEDTADTSILPVSLRVRTNPTAALSADVSSRCPTFIWFFEWRSCAGLFTEQHILWTHHFVQHCHNNTLTISQSKSFPPADAYITWNVLWFLRFRRTVMQW